MSDRMLIVLFLTIFFGGIALMLGLAVPEMIQRTENRIACEQAGGTYLFRGDVCIDPDTILDTP